MKMRNTPTFLHRLKKGLSLAILAFATNTHAADTALLIGVGEHFDSEHDLPGIKLDIDTMKMVASNMGYKNIVTLLNKDATEARILTTLKSLGGGLAASDRFLFYFSGHGTRIPDFNGDEPDNADEVLVASDVRLATFHGVNTLDGVVVDDELSQILQGFKNAHTFALIDACNSGTVTSKSFLNTVGSGVLNRNGASSGKRKMMSWAGMPLSKEAFKAFEVEEKLGGFVSISAAGDEEYAIATSEGSIFTLAIQNAVTQRINRDGAFKNVELTPQTIRDFAKSYIDERVDPTERFSPRLAGNRQLYMEALPVNIPVANGPNWRRLNQLISGNELKLTSTKTTYKVGELLESEISLPLNGQGYLNIIQVDSRDNVNVLFPNKFHQDSKIDMRVGKLGINKELNGFNIRAAKDPLGDVLLFAFVTSSPLNLYSSSNNLRDNAGKLLDTVVNASQKGIEGVTRSFVVEEASGFSYAGKLKLTIR